MLIPSLTRYRSIGSNNLYRTVLREGVIYYLYLSTLSTANVIITKTLPPNNSALLLLMERFLHSMLTSRVLLHIRRHGTDTSQGWSSTARLEELGQIPKPIPRRDHQGFAAQHRLNGPDPSEQEDFGRPGQLQDRGNESAAKAFWGPNPIA